MDIAIHPTYSSSKLHVPVSIHAHLTQLYTELQSRHEAQRVEMIEYKSKANYWETQFHQAKRRETELVNENEELKAKLRKREQQLFGRKTEKNTASSEQISTAPGVGEIKKNRGQQIGSVGHGRRDYSHLLTTEEIVSLSEEDTHCRCCG